MKLLSGRLLLPSTFSATIIFTTTTTSIATTPITQVIASITQLHRLLISPLGLWTLENDFSYALTQAVMHYNIQPHHTKARYTVTQMYVTRRKIPPPPPRNPERVS